jgi:dihydropteroate synthase
MTSVAPTILTWKISPARSLPLDQPRIMGVLNVTPDSFSDGGVHLDRAAAVEHALRMQEQGAAIIDIGGESTRPGAVAITPNEQIARTVPVIEAIRRTSGLPISIDTTSAAVAAAALDVGADIINDISAGRDDEAMLSLAASRGCGLILMHRLRLPAGDSYSDQYVDEPRYDDVVAEVRDFLLERAAVAERAGVDRAAIAIDPGLGFGKSVAQNFELIARARALVETGYPVLCGASRKSFIGRATGVEEPAQRIIGSVAASVAMFLQSVKLFRVHDVAEHREALAVGEAVLSASASLDVLDRERVP